MSDSAPSWDAPIPLGSRLCWFYDDQNMTIPIVSVEGVYTDERGNGLDAWMQHGYTAVLPVENGATVHLLYDPKHSPESPFDESPVSLWIYVRHPQDGRLIDARLERDDKANYWITYDPECLAGDCPACEHGIGQWWEYVHDGPPHVMQRLRWLGSLPIKVHS